MDKCIFCKVISGELPGTFLYRDNDVVVFKDIHPQAPVHWLIVSKEHILELVEANDALLTKMIIVIKKIVKQEKLLSYRIVSNGRGAALIDHLHIHVMGGIDKLRKL